MKCEIGQHKIGVNYDFDYQCLNCWFYFVSEMRFDPRNCILEKEIKKILNQQFGLFWKLELWKLQVLRRFIKKIRLSGIIRLNMYKIYTWEDISKPIEELNYIDDI